MTYPKMVIRDSMETQDPGPYNEIIGPRTLVEGLELRSLLSKYRTKDLMRNQDPRPHREDLSRTHTL